MATLCEKFYNETKEYSMCGFYHFCSPVILIREPEIIKNVLSTNFSSFSKNPIELSCPEKDGLLRRHPFFQKGDEWKKGRARMGNCLSSLKIKSILPLVRTCVLKLNTNLKEQSKTKGTFDLNIKELLNKFTGEVSSNLVGIEDGNFQEDKDSVENYNKVIGKLFETPSLAAGLQQMMLFYAPAFAKLMKFGFTPKEVDHYFRQIATKIIKKRKEEKLVHNDFLQIVMDYEQIHSITENEELLAASHMLSFAFDLYELIAITISHLLNDLAHRPEIQNKVREEITAVLDKYNGELTLDAIKEMTFFDKVLNESQRMNHILGVFFKICTKRTKLEGKDGLLCVVEPGQMVAISAYGLQMDPKYWKDPEIFDPERFDHDEKKNNGEKFAFLPFGEGPRMCIGMRLSLILMKLSVSGILRDFSVQPSSKMIVPMRRDETNFLNFPKGGFWVKILPLKTSALSTSESAAVGVVV
ncbi:cytochrome P450 6k1-like [Leptopilina heterotoma]|uniref:cytochrome P450 6k1-like n=1 Tax=Leptopilina heterotoma TaxID=63436 RepID=UPI001CA9348E|nr:cytochrome P450 6k1-like [Leptopilina heterotoma]